MDLLEVKPFLPIDSTQSPSILPESASSSVGPLFFKPIPDSITCLHTSRSLSPPFLPPPPRLSLSRFLQTTTPDAPVLPSTASAISSSFNDVREAATSLHNRLETLPYSKDRVLVFLPTGNNLDQIGFLVLSVGDSGLSVKVDVDCDVFMSEEKLNHQIVKLSASPVTDDSYNDGGSVIIGFLMARTVYSVHWFNVRIKGLGSDSEKPRLVYLGSKRFNRCAVAHACWNPYSPEECAALLENGALFFFDVKSPSSSGLNAKFGGKRLRVPWDEGCQLDERGWFSCEFSWHSRILVANAKAVFLVDFTTEKCHASCILKIDVLGTDNGLIKDQFVSFSKAGPDGFFYSVASKNKLLLCDVREARPVLQWIHGLCDPRFLTVVPLSELRSNASDDNYKWASEKGFCIILGSFWNCDFSIFCYGPSPFTLSPFTVTKGMGSPITLYGWNRPLDLCLSGRDCFCGSCLLREELAKDDLPSWIEWQQKKDLVLGFFILKKDFSSQLSKPHDSGGFTMVRLMSYGELEAQGYGVSWDAEGVVGAYHDTPRLQRHGSFLYSFGDENYKFPKRFKYLKLDYLYSYLNGVLSKELFSKFRKSVAAATNDKCSDTCFLEFLCEKFKMLGFGPCISSLSVSDVFRDVSFPTSMYEMACRKTWTMLPLDALELAFSRYPEILSVVVDGKTVSLDFSVVPDEPQLPPFFARNPSHRSNKWSTKTKRSDDFVGPVVPLPALLVLNEIREHGHSFLEKVREFSPDTVLALQCEEILQQAKEFSVPDSMNDRHSTYLVSLMDDREETWAGSSVKNPFFMYRPSAFLDELGSNQRDYVEEDEKYMNMIGKFHENEGTDGKTGKVGMEFFDDLCALDLKFHDQDLNFEPMESEAYKKLKTRFSKWRDGFSPYQEFCANLKPQSEGL